MVIVQNRRKDFLALAAYLVWGERGRESERVAWTAARNLPTDDPELAAIFMRATAAQSDRVEKPVYHIALSFAPSDRVDRAMMERVADRVLERLGLAEHQAVLVAHCDRPHPHVHIVVNRVHPETGRAWNAWQDWPRAAQALREEERALGLREVPRRLAPGRVPEAADRLVPASASEAKGARIAALTLDLRAYERVVELTREQYVAQIDASAARARGMQLDLAAERARTALANADRALALVYRDSERARRAYLSAVEQQGMAEATRLMRARPEQFGALVAVELGRAFGLWRRADERPARAAAPAAAAAAREAREAAQGWQVTAEAEAQRVEQVFARELGPIYHEPLVARTAFERVAVEHDAEHAAATLRERPQALAAIRASLSRDGSRFEEQLARAAACGVQALEARAVANAATGPARDAHLDTERAMRASEADRAAAQEARIQATLRGLPDRAELERRIGSLLHYLWPREVRVLRAVVTAPQFAIARQLKGTLRDLALGREEERDQSR